VLEKARGAQAAAQGMSKNRLRKERTGKYESKRRARKEKDYGLSAENLTSAGVQNFGDGAMGLGGGVGGGIRG